MLTTGAFIHPDAVPNISNIHVASFIPGSEILKQSQAVIHCGGNGTTYQAMSQGVPAVVIPFNNDQTINAWLIKRHKVGLPLSIKEVHQWLTSCCEVKVAYRTVHQWARYRRWRKIKSPTSCSREKQKAGAVEEFKKTVISN